MSMSEGKEKEVMQWEVETRRQTERHTLRVVSIHRKSRPLVYVYNVQHKFFQESNSEYK